MANAPLLFLGAAVAPAPMQSNGAPLCRAPPMAPMAGAPWLNQSTHYPSTYVAPPAWSMYIPSYLPRPQAQQSSCAMQRQELESRELEFERRTGALNLYAVRDAET